MSTTAAPRLRQMPGLDGLRAVAVTAVIVYHLSPSALPGGYLGVDVFFVISGYLITALLLAEYRQSSAVSLRRFWGRRARRLLPALVVLLAATTALAAVFARDTLGRLRVDVPASLFYVMNWRLVAQHQSYAASFGRPPLLLHLWSLSVEEQFYLLWPLALLFLRRRLAPARVALAALGGAALSALLMAVLFDQGNPSAVYFGTETHAQGLLIGAALAAAVPPWRMPASISEGARRVLDRLGLTCLAALVAGFALLGFDSSYTYRGGMVGVDLGAAVVVAVAAHPASSLGRHLTRQPLRWIGLRSYSLYLWHWPLFVIFDSGPAVLLFLLRLALTAVAAELSYRYVEQPWRTGRAQEKLRAALAGTRRPLVLSSASAGVAGLAVLLATAPGVPTSPAILAEGATPAARTTLPPRPQSLPGPLVGPVGAEASMQVGATPLSVRTAPPTTAAPAATTARTVAAANPLAGRLPVLAIGDSVLLAASPALEAMFGPQITIDAAVGRQVSAGLQRLAEYKASGALTRYRSVMIDLGTNGAFEPSQFAELVELTEGVPAVVVFDVHAARSWAAESNATITSGVAAHPGWMRLADWNKAAGAPGMLYPDGVHPTLAGAQAYAQLLAAALR